MNATQLQDMLYGTPPPRREVRDEVTVARGLDVAAEAYQLYIGGMSMETVGKRYGVTRQRIHALFVALNLPRRHRQKRADRAEARHSQRNGSTGL